MKRPWDSTGGTPNPGAGGPGKPAQRDTAQPGKGRGKKCSRQKAEHV